ncbi:macro domain-containing protein [Stomatobaculum longum]
MDGNAKITKGYHLLRKYVIHAVGPRWRNGICSGFRTAACPDAGDAE